MIGSEIKYCELACDKELVKYWARYELVKNNLWLSWSPIQWAGNLKSGFHFCVYHFSSGSVINCDSIYDPELHVDVLFEGTAYFDGVRHMYCNTRDEDPYFRGYLYYYQPWEMVLIFKKLDELVKRHCSDPC